MSTVQAQEAVARSHGYRLLERLSRGNDLDVYAAWSQERDCSCVVKLVRPDRVDDDRAERLLREGRLLTEMSHPHLVRGYQTLCEPGVGPMVVMETLTGATLSCLIPRHGLRVSDVTVLGLQLCSVLHYLHGRGVVHLDLKPSNVVCQDSRAVLLDLSLAQAPGSCAPGSGTPEYMAPEQVAGGWADAATDVWGLGGVLYRAMTGRRPFPDLRRERSAGDPIDPRPLRRRGVHRPVAALVAACLEQRPENRPALTDVRDTLRSADM